MLSERSVRTDISREGTPGTPSKKRVRYADEEQLPLETFKDPSPNRYVHLPLPLSRSKLMEEYHHHRKRGVNHSYLRHLVVMKGSQRPTSLHIKLQGLMARTNRLQENHFLKNRLLRMIMPLKTKMRMMTLREWCVTFPSWNFMFDTDQ
jgi:hypothetical protein